MNHVSDIVQQMSKRTRLDEALTEVRTITPPPEPQCSACNDLGVYKLAVPFEDPRFGKLFPCDNPDCEAGRAYKVDLWQRRIKAAGIPYDYQTFTMDSFWFAIEHDIQGKNQAWTAATHFLTRPLHQVSIAGVWRDCGRTYPDADRVCNSLIFQGSYGVGKTGLAVAIINYVVQELRQPAMYIRVQDFINSVQARYKTDEPPTPESVIEAAKLAPLLCLDEMNMAGAEKSSDKQNIMEEVIRHRYMNALPTLVTCNADKDGLEAQWGRRTVEALLGMAHYIPMGGFDMRRKSADTSEVF